VRLESRPDGVEAIEELRDERVLKRGAEIGEQRGIAVARIPCSRASRIAPDLIPLYEKSSDSSLELRDGKRETLRIGGAAARVFLDLRATGIRQSDELRDLVERLADRVVARAVDLRDRRTAHVVDRECPPEITSERKRSGNAESARPSFCRNGE
jgi:hypothetical protein